jgi:uncharacterized protein YjbI with pentapeptide repeats
MPADKIQQDFLEISSNIAKTVVTVLAFSFFCVFTLLGAPDRELVAAGAQITIPVAKVGVSFKGFLVLGPLLLIAFFVHLHIFVAYWLALREVADNPRRGAYVFNLPFFSTGFLSSILFYWLVPAVIGVFAWKAAPQPFAGRILFVAFLTMTAWSLLTQIRRRPESRRGGNAPLWALLAGTGLALISSSSLFPKLDLYSSIRSFRGGMTLAGAELAGQDLRGRFLEDADLTGASLVGAKLTNARMFNAKLVRADLRGADLSSADLRRADLTDAILEPSASTADPGNASEAPAVAQNTTKMVEAKLSDAILKGANLNGADLTDADLTRAHLGASESGRSASLSRANLRRAQLASADLQHADLRGAVLVQADMTNAKMHGALLNPADDGTSSDLTEAGLQGAILSGADLREAIVRGANLREADLSGADLTTAVRLSRSQIAEACIRGADNEALLPEALLEQPPPCESETGSD